MPLITPVIGIVLVSFGMVLISQGLQRKLVDRKKLKRDQARMKDLQKQLKELLKENDEQSKKKADEMQKEMLGLMNSTMMGSFKPMMITMPIFLGIYWVLGSFYSGGLVELPIPLPVFHLMPEFPWIQSFEITDAISWRWWYIYSALISGLVINIILKMIDKKKDAQKM